MTTKHKPVAKIQITFNGRSISGVVNKFFDGFKIQLRVDGRKALLPATQDCEWDSLDRAIEVLVDEIRTRFLKEIKS